MGLQAVGGVGDLAMGVLAPAGEGALGVQGAAVCPTRADGSEGARGGVGDLAIGVPAPAGEGTLSSGCLKRHGRPCTSSELGVVA